MTRPRRSTASAPPRSPRRPRAALAGEVEAALRASVRRRLMADVPLGAMCSGGIDSSLIAAFARDEQPGLVAFNAAVADQPAVDESAVGRARGAGTSASSCARR